MAAEATTEQGTSWRGGRWRVPFFTIWGGQALSLVGSSVAQFALVWWLTETTGSATVLAIGSLIAMLPQIILGPVAGALVDRWNRRVVMIVADGVVALAALWLALLFLAGQAQVGHVYVLMLVRSLGGMFHWPAMQASTSLMVPKAQLGRVSGINQALNGGLNIVGPAVGALLLAVTDIHNIMFFDVATAAFAIAPLLFIAIPQPVKEKATAGAPASSIWAELREGASYLFRWRGLMLLTALALIVKFALTPAFSLFPILVTQHYGGDAAALAGMEGAFGIGVVAGGLLLGVWGGFKRQMATSLMGIVGIGVATLAAGLLPPALFVGAIAAVFLLGMAVALTDGPLFAVLQGTVAPDMQGRVFMLFGSVIGLTSPLGLAVAGPITDAVGVTVWYIVAGVLCVGFGVAGYFMPAIMQLEDYGKAQRAAGKAERAADNAESEAALVADVAPVEAPAR